MSEIPWTLPPGYRRLETLVQEERRAVLLCSRDEPDRGGRERAVLRLERERLGDGGGGERRAELAVLAAVRHPGLARLLDHGSLGAAEAGAVHWLARSWVAGVDLGRHVEGLRRGEPVEVAAQRIGALVARLCPALQHLHSAGFVHADLKPGNVIVTPDEGGGRPVLTDFGLSRARESGAPEPSPESGAVGVAGTLFAIAPEVLLGAAPDARSDLFALGVLLHQLLAGRRVGARDFYARFPREGFLAAVGTSPDELPAWSRDIVARLLSRDPARRPESAAAVGRALAARLGLQDVTAALAEVGRAPAFPFRTGREDWFAGLVERVDAQSPRETVGALVWVHAPAGEDVRVLAGELALARGLGGGRVRRLDLEVELERARDAAALDAWAAETAEAARGTWLVVALEPGTAQAWRERALLALARALSSTAPAQNDGARLLVAAAGPRPIEAAALGGPNLALPPVPVDAIERFLAALLPGESGEAGGDGLRVARFARLLDAAGRGAAAAIGRALRAAYDEGWIVPGDEDAAGAARARLRPGTLPAALDSQSGLLPPVLSRGARVLAAALHVCGGRAGLDRLAAVAAGGAEELATSLSELVDHALAERAGYGLAAVLVATSPPPATAVPEADWRALARRCADDLERRGAPAAEVLARRHRAGESGDATLAAEAAQLRDRGSPELALELCDSVRRESLRGGPRPGPVLEAERALAWCALGAPERAEEVAREMERAAGAGAGVATERALLERVRGRIAAARHEHAAALERFERALALDPADGGEALLGKVQFLYELRRDRELVALAGTADTATPRTAALVRTFAAMSRLRLGEVELARELLAAELERALAEGDAARAAGLRVNLGTLERRAGALELALGHFEAAVGYLERSGVPTRLAEARALYAAALRDAGELRRSERPLAAALAARERMGDLRGAAAVRGMLGLCLADRGHARPALQELERSAADLRDAGREADAFLLLGRADEVRARLGVETADAAPIGGVGESGRAAEGDPRVLLARARAAALRGMRDRALDCAARAAAQGRSLGLPAVVGEARLLERWLADPPGPAAESGEPSAPAGLTPALWVRDERLLALLARGPWSPADESAARTEARELERAGRDDRAARLWLALATRGREAHERESAAARAAELLAACAAGAGDDETRTLRRALLGLPDPWPEDLRVRPSEHEENDMEVLSLLEINHRLLGQENLAGLLGTIVEQALEVSGAQRGFLVLEEDGELAIDTAMDSRRGGLEASEVELSGSVLRDALDRMRPVRVSDAVDDPLLRSAPSVIKLELRSVLCVPFAVQPGLRGVVYVDHRLREAAFDERTERVLGLLADQAGLAILQVRRLEEIRRLNGALNREKASVESDLLTAKAALHSAGLPAPAGGLVGSSPAMRAVHHLLERAAPNTLPVLVCGASGTGKELAARALHELSARADGPFVVENCAALPPSLIEAELFGATKGAFTGADRDREGLFERAHGGTFFLDEIGELPLELQAKLLRVLETSTVRRVGGARERKVDFRLVVATNRDLEREVAEGRFRADLFYRLHGLRVELPLLSARRADIPALVDHYLRSSAPPGRAPREVSEAVVARLCRREWPGNVRELFNELARLGVMCEGAIDDPQLVRDAGLETAPAGVDPSGPVRTMAELEREAIERALAQTGGDKRAAAELLGISRAKIYQRLKEWKQDEGE